MQVSGDLNHSETLLMRYIGPGGRVAPIPGAVTRVQLEPKGDVKKVKLR